MFHVKHCRLNVADSSHPRRRGVIVQREFTTVCAALFKRAAPQVEA